MARIIKLRTWDSINRVLSPLSSLEQLTDPRYEVTQFTGLYDANGVEVWEGDITRWSNFDADDLTANYAHYLVIHHNGCFGTICNRGSDFSPFSDMLGWLEPNGVLRQIKDEVVGTKYTDLHLLDESGEWEGFDTARETVFHQLAL
ncbi:hypothetical protein FAES_1835 [Fibrella aestuarina BUZ 2]|uniref:YopX protein domain-containing protein n=1 Tax=Fibrella aestuarina BUZ 2 TaxID=1166018 RepID=I0K6U2_9BACT|nr:YopX family protein [Fibrella aestuarina]CCG99845.1 hypothetical protein FAES_1835 [Fibrella aestuarina BUZ 2]